MGAKNRLKVIEGAGKPMRNYGAWGTRVTRRSFGPRRAGVLRLGFWRNPVAAPILFGSGRGGFAILILLEFAVEGGFAYAEKACGG